MEVTLQTKTKNRLCMMLHTVQVQYRRSGVRSTAAGAMCLYSLHVLHATACWASLQDQACMRAASSMRQGRRPLGYQQQDEQP